MDGSSPSKRRRRNTSGSISLETGRSNDFFLRSEDMLAPLQSKDVLLGSCLDARTSEDVAKNILLPNPAATAATAAAAKAGEKLKAPDREEKIGKLSAKLERNSTGDALEYPVPLGSLRSKPPSLRPLVKNARISSRDWIEDLTASPPPLSIPLAGHLACTSLKKPANAASAASAALAAKSNASPLASAATGKKKKKSRKRMFDETAIVEPNDGDVLSGRGGFTNNHPGNVRFRNEALRLRPWYRKSSKEEKQVIADLLVDFVRNKGNRFLGKGKDGRWHEMIGKGPHSKASQALRERIRGGNGD